MPQNKKHIINERRAKVAELYLQGMWQYKIAEIVGVTHQQVSLDLKHLSRKWQESALMDIDKIKARELAKIDKLEKEYYRGWERSASIQTKKRMKKSDRGWERSASIQTKKRMKKSDRGIGEIKEQSLEENQLIGDPRFLDGILKCIAKREEIFGYGSAKKLDITQYGEVIILPSNDRDPPDKS